MPYENKFYGNDGPAIVVSKSQLTFQHLKLEMFYNTNAGSSIVTFANYISIMFQDAVAILVNNSGQHSVGSLVANTTEVTFKSSFKVNFTGNSGESNGAISLYSKSRLTFTAMVLYPQMITASFIKTMDGHF